jgi:protein-tyrosine phosphatase
LSFHIIVLLTEEDIEYYYHGTLLQLYEFYGFKVIHYPIPDFGIPKSLESFAELQNQLVKLTETNRILIHCRGGLGRTGLVVAGLFVTLGNEPKKAIRMVLGKRLLSMETKEQKTFLFEYARR